VNDRPSGDAAGLTAIDGPAVVRMLSQAHDRVVQHQHWLDELNVFPVADADSGRNMAATLAAVSAAAGAVAEADPAASPGLSAVVAAAQPAAIRAARGNSGVILAEWLRGFLSALPGPLHRAFTAAAEDARASMDQPVEGTMITVAADVAAAAVATRDRGMVEILASAQQEAEASVARSPSLLPVLARHGVVDAGGAGLLCVLDGFVLAVGGDAPDGRGAISAIPVDPAASVDNRVEVMLTVEGTAVDVDRIERAWRELGDSIGVAGYDDLWRLHVHTDRPEQAIAIAERFVSVVDRVMEPLVEDHP
jgi:dihydroxyacetone kinase-like predicted kinase